MSFRLVSNSVTLNGVIVPIRCVFSPNSVAFGAHYVKVFEDIPILSAAECSPKDAVLALYHLYSRWLPRTSALFLASAASTSDLQSQILSVTSCATDIHFDTYLTTGKHCQRLIRFLASNPSGTDLVYWHLGHSHFLTVSYIRDSAGRRSLRRLRSFAVTDFGTKQKPYQNV